MDSSLIDAKIAEANQKRWRGISDGLAWFTTQQAAEEERKADGHDPADHEFMVNMAREEHAKDGECEIDDGAVVSWGDDHGAYVAAWVFVYFPTCEKCDEKHLPSVECQDQS